MRRSLSLLSRTNPLWAPACRRAGGGGGVGRQNIDIGGWPALAGLRSDALTSVGGRGMATLRPAGGASSGLLVGRLGEDTGDAPRWHRAAAAAGTAAAAAALSLGVNDPVKCAGADDVFEVPKSVVYSTVAGAAGYLALRYVMPVLLDPAKHHKDMQRDYQNTVVIAEKLERAVDATRAALGEPPVSPLDFLRALSLYSATWATKTTDDPLFVVKLVDGATDGAEATHEEIADLLQHFPLAVAAYDDTTSVEEVVSKSEFTLLYHDTITAAARQTSHFVCYHPEQKRIVVSVKGTSSLDDIITDTCLAPMPLRHDGKHGDVADSDTLAHEAIAAAARNLSDRLGPLLKIISESHPDFEVTITGHSLGAGTACLLAILLKEDCGIPNVRAVAFASPPVIDRDAAIKARDYVTSVVNNADIIPRVSIRNAAVLGEVLAGIITVMETSGDGAVADEAEAIVKRALAAVPPQKSDLHVPGKVVFLVKDENGGVHARVGDGTMSPLGVIAPVSNLITDHLWVSYNDALEKIGRESFDKLKKKRGSS